VNDNELTQASVALDKISVRVQGILDARRHSGQ
jgi:hypothetical protein